MRNIDTVAIPTIGPSLRLSLRSSVISWYYVKTVRLVAALSPSLDYIALQFSGTGRFYTIFRLD